MSAARGASASDEPSSRLWTIAETAHFLGVPVPTMYRWRTQGSGPPAYRVGKHLRYDPLLVRRWLEDGAT